MSTSVLQRIAPWAGFLFVVLFVVGFLLPGEVPGGTDPDADVVSFYEDSGNRIQLMASGYLLTAAGLAFLLFAAGLRERLALAESPVRALPRVAFAAGVLFVAMLFVMATAAGFTIAAGVEFQDEPIDPGVARFLPHLGFAAFLVPGLLSAALLITITSFHTLRTAVFPIWSAWLGFLLAVVLLFGVLFVTGLALLVWVLVISALMLTQSISSVEATD